MRQWTISDVRCHKGDSAFLLDDGETTLLYDTGFGFTGFQVAENIEKVLHERPLDYIFLSHSHYDHALGSAYVLRKYPGAKVVAGTHAASVFKRDGAKRVMKELDRKFADALGVGDYPFLGDELRVDIAVNDGDVVTAGEHRFQVLDLPGHTRCSIGYFSKEDGLFLSSETLGVFDGEESIVPSFLVGYQMSLEAIDRVKDLQIWRLIAPHLGELSEEKTRFFLENMKKAAEETAGEILERLKQGREKDEIIAWYKEKFWKGYIREIYPEDAVNLNTSIMIELLRKEKLAEE